MKKVLIVEDDFGLQASWKRDLESSVILFAADSINAAEKLFTENQDIDLVVMDACVPGDSPTTIPLIHKIRETYKGPMIATSSISAYRKMLMEAGCNIECIKQDVVKKVLEVLSIT